MIGVLIECSNRPASQPLVVVRSLFAPSASSATLLADLVEHRVDGLLGQPGREGTQHPVDTGSNPAHHRRRRYSKQFSMVNADTADGTGTHL
jgi:hypothetical protein